MKEIIELIQNNPNDMELGKKLREMYNTNKLDRLKSYTVSPETPTRPSDIEGELYNPSM